MAEQANRSRNIISRVYDRFLRSFPSAKQRRAGASFTSPSSHRRAATPLVRSPNMAMTYFRIAEVLHAPQH